MAGAVVALADSLRVASNVPADQNADAVAAFLPQIFERVNQSTRELRMGALNNVGFTVGNVPWKIFYVWEGGMSFHGGLLGLVLAVYFFAKLQGINPLSLGDVASAATSFGLFFGRIANFINGELWGRPADPSLPWAMVFPQSGSDVARHPSQIYQFALEGLLLFVLLWLYSSKQRRPIQ